MANQPETATYDAGVYQFETTDPVQGGVGGNDNKPLLNLANRTAWLKVQVDSILSQLLGLAPKDNPTFTGTVTVPTAASGDSTTKAASTAFIQAALGAVAAVNVAGSSNVTLTAAQYGCGLVVLSGAITANINVIFPTQGDQWVVLNSTTGAFTVTCKTASGAGIVVAQGKSRDLFCDGANIKAIDSDFDSVALTGNPTGPTQAPGTADTTLATTAFAVAAAGAAFGAETTKASATTTDLGTAGSRLVQVTGTTNITAFGSGAAVANPVYIVRFAGILTLTHNATSLILPGGANITTAAGDGLIALYQGSGNWRVLEFFRASALPLPAALASNVEVQAGTDSAKIVTPAGLASLTANATRSGLVELATDVEAQNKVDGTRALTPANLAALGASDTAAGLVELATTAEASAGTDTARAVTPAGLQAAINTNATPSATTTVQGKVELATDAEAIAGTDTSRAITPSNLTAAMASYVPQATTTAQGKVELATDAEAQAGTDTVRALTPSNLASVTSTTTRAGLVELATSAEVQAGTDTVRAVTPAGLVSLTADTTRAGLVELATNAEAIAGSDTTRAVPPSALAAALADLLSKQAPFARVNGRSTAGGATILRQRNIASVTRTSTAGTYDVLFTTPMPDDTYAPTFGILDSGTTNQAASVMAISAAGFTVRFQNGNANQGSGASDPTSFSIHIDY